LRYIQEKLNKAESLLIRLNKDSSIEFLEKNIVEDVQQLQQLVLNKIKDFTRTISIFEDRIKELEGKDK